MTVFILASPWFGWLTSWDEKKMVARWTWDPDDAVLFPSHASASQRADWVRAAGYGRPLVVRKELSDLFPEGGVE